MVIEGIITIGTITDHIIEIDQEADGITTGQVIGVAFIRITIDEVIWDQTTDKIPNGLLETEVNVGTEMKITTMIIQEVGVEIDMIIDTSNREEKKSRSQSNSRVSTNNDHIGCYRCWEYDHFASECPNSPTDEEPDYDNADSASLQMIMQNYYTNDSEGEVEYLNL